MSSRTMTDLNWSSALIGAARPPSTSCTAICLDEPAGEAAGRAHKRAVDAGAVGHDGGVDPGPPGTHAIVGIDQTTRPPEELIVSVP